MIELYLKLTYGRVGLIYNGFLVLDYGFFYAKDISDKSVLRYVQNTGGSDLSQSSFGLLYIIGHLYLSGWKLHHDLWFLKRYNHVFLYLF